MDPFSISATNDTVEETPLYLYEPFVEQRELERTLEALARWDNLHRGHHHELRRYERFDYSSPMVVAATLDDDNLALPADAWIAFTCWSRNVSKNGVSMLAAERLFPFDAILDDMPILRSDRLARVEESCVLCLPRAGRCPLWTAARVVRCRRVHGGMYEIGCKFLDRSGIRSPNLCVACQKLLHATQCPPEGPESALWEIDGGCPRDQQAADAARRDALH